MARNYLIIRKGKREEKALNATHEKAERGRGSTTVANCSKAGQGQLWPKIFNGSIPGSKYDAK